MSGCINFHPDYSSNPSNLELTVNKYGTDVDIHTNIYDLAILLNDVLSDWYVLTKEQRDMFREIFHDPITYEE
jgi:hypothetical protein